MTEARKDLHPHPRPRVGKTAKEWRANPNKEADRKHRQWQRAVDSAKKEDRYRHK